MKKKEKVITIIEIVLGSLVVLSLVAAVILQCALPQLEISIWMKENIWDVSSSVEGLKSQLPIIIQSVIYIFLIIVISKFLRRIFKTQIDKSDRAKTVVTLFDGLVKYGCAIAVIIFVLKACGVDTAALIASVGVLTLIIGLGAQTLIADIIAGMFIIFENGRP